MPSLQQPEEGDQLPPLIRRKRRVPEVGTPLTVSRPQIKEVMDTETGKIQSVQTVIGSDYDQLIQLRMRIRTALHKEEALYRCAICLSPVYICGQPTSHLFYFKHKHEDGNCPAVTRGEINQDEIDARRYNGAKESLAHRKIKEWVTECLRADNRFQDIAQESVWKGAVSGKWRKPDVRALYNQIPIAFEIQLSTTYLDVIVGRQQFYLEQGGLLFWIFASFDNEHRRLTEEDVFYNNNQNVFIVNATTVEKSRQTQRFMLECVWAEPTSNGGTSALHRRIISFDELTLERSTQRAYYFDYDGHRQKLSDAEDTEITHLRNEIEAWFGRSGLYTERDEWGKFALRLRKRGINVSRKTSEVNLYALVGLYSAKHGYPYGQGKKRLVEIAHHIASSHKHNLSWFMHAVKHYGRLASMQSEGNPELWRKKIERCRAEYKVDSTPFHPDKSSKALVEFLFPELAPLP